MTEIMANKPTTEDILKKIRQQGAGNAGAPPPAEPASPAPATAADSSAASPAPAAGGNDILAKIRSQGAAGAAKPAPGPGAAPKSTADILAAIRGGGAPSAASTPAAPKAAARSEVPASELPPVDRMLEQLKSGVKAPAAPAKPELKIPVKPSKPAAAPVQSRRSALLQLVTTPFALAWIVLSATGGAWVLMLARFMFPNVLVEPPSRFKIGSPSDYPPGTVSTKWTAARGIWVVHTDQYKGRDLIYALASVCTHLGCTPSWLEGEQKFKCPCHGSGFYITGVNFEGPAPRPLERVGLRLAPDGMLEVDKSLKFQEEKGQWDDGKSYVDASLA